MKTLAVIPARGGSKSIPRKNLVDVAGRPLIAWVIGAAREAKRLDRIVVSTEDEEIAETARRWGAEAPFARPPELATDTVSLIPVVQHALAAMDGLGFRADAVVSLQPTSPGLTGADVDAAVAKLEDSGADSVAGSKEETVTSGRTEGVSLLEKKESVTFLHDRKESVSFLIWHSFGRQGQETGPGTVSLWYAHGIASEAEMVRSRIAAGLIVAAALAAGTVSLESRAAKPFRIEVSFPASLESKALDGRVILVISRRQAPEPRFAQMTGINAQPMFGVDVNGLKPGQPAVFDTSTRGWPVESLRDIPPGEYYVQATLNVYTTVTRADGHTIKVHLDQGEGQDYRRSPGNLVTNVEKVRIDPTAGGVVKIAFARKNPPIEPPADTKYVKHIRFKSDLFEKDVDVLSVPCRNLHTLILSAPLFDEDVLLS